MVTLILVFLFLSPRFLDFKDKPVETVALHCERVPQSEERRAIRVRRADFP